MAKKRRSAREIVRIGRPKKYDEKGLRRAVEDYFLSICYLEQVIENEPVVLAEDPVTGAVTYQLDKYGHVMTKRVQVLDGNGIPLQRLCWVTPPGEDDLCMRLGISRDTWDRYGREESGDYAEIVALARGRIRAYLEAATESRGGRGAQFKLERIYGLKQQVDVDLHGNLEQYLQTLGQETEW